MLSFLFPKECLVCSKTGLWLCKTCQKNLFDTLPSCIVCKKLSNGFQTHSVCSKNSCLDSVVTFWRYNEYSKKLVHSFKYKDRYRVGEFLFSLFENKLEKIDFESSVLIPLPSHRSKVLERGFNPTQNLCEMISEKKRVCVNTNFVTKNKAISAQASLEYSERFDNVKDIFSVNEDESKKIKKFKKILIVDDIVTTGATINELAFEIKKNLNYDIEIHGVCVFQGIHISSKK